MYTVYTRQQNKETETETEKEDAMLNLNEVKEAFAVVEPLVSWAGYTPPGGESWRKLWDTKVKQVMLDAQAGAAKTLKVLKAEADGRNQVLRRLQHMVEDLQEIKAMQKTCGLEALQSMDEFEKVLTFNRQYVEVLRDRMENEDYRAEVDADQKYIEGFLFYMEGDALFDRMLWALHKVEPKYRMKIFRLCRKLMTEIMATRETLRASKSKIAKVTSIVTKPIFDSLDKAYADLAPLLTKMRKIADKEGAKAFADIGDNELALAFKH